MRYCWVRWNVKKFFCQNDKCKYITSWLSGDYSAWMAWMRFIRYCAPLMRKLFYGKKWLAWVSSWGLGILLRLFSHQSFSYFLFPWYDLFAPLLIVTYILKFVVFFYHLHLRQTMKDWLVLVLMSIEKLSWTQIWDI